MDGELIKKIIISVVSLGAMGASIFWAINKIGGGDAAPVITSGPAHQRQTFNKEKTIFEDFKFRALKDNSVNFIPVERIKAGNKNPFRLPEKEENE